MKSIPHAKETIKSGTHHRPRSSKLTTTTRLLLLLELTWPKCTERRSAFSPPLGWVGFVSVRFGSVRWIGQNGHEKEGRGESQKKKRPTQLIQAHRPTLPLVRALQKYIRGILEDAQLEGARVVYGPYWPKPVHWIYRWTAATTSIALLSMAAYGHVMKIVARQADQVRSWPAKHSHQTNAAKKTENVGGRSNTVAKPGQYVLECS